MGSREDLARLLHGLPPKEEPPAGPPGAVNPAANPAAQTFTKEEAAESFGAFMGALGDTP